MEREYAPDFELLALKYVLGEHLAEHGLLYFEHYAQIETDLSNREIKVELRCAYSQEVRRAFEGFARTHGFPRLFYSPDRGAVYLRR